MAFEFTDANFAETVTESKGLSVVDFWAEWCGPCKAIAPIIDELSQEYQGQVTIGKMDVDSNPEVSFKYKVRNIPTILFIKDGKVVHKQVGAAPKSKLQELIEEHK